MAIYNNITQFNSQRFSCWWNLWFVCSIERTQANHGKYKMHETSLDTQSIGPFYPNSLTNHDTSSANLVTGQTHPQPQGSLGNPNPTNPPHSAHSHWMLRGHDPTRQAKTPSTSNRFSPLTPAAHLQTSPPPDSAPPRQTSVGSIPTRRPGFSGAPNFPPGFPSRPKLPHCDLNWHRHCRRRGSIFRQYHAILEKVEDELAADVLSREPVFRGKEVVGGDNDGGDLAA